MTTVQILERARGLIDTPEKWWSGFGGARNRLCLGLAVSEVCLGDVSESACCYLTTAICGAACHDPKIIFDFNDTHTHEQVLDVLDLAIAAAKGDEQKVAVETPAAELVEV
jgi:hypothetical protein